MNFHISLPLSQNIQMFVFLFLFEFSLWKMLSSESITYKSIAVNVHWENEEENQTNCSIFWDRERKREWKKPHDQYMQRNLKKPKYSIFKTMDMKGLTTQTMVAADKDVEWVKVHSFFICVELDDWLILRSRYIWPSFTFGSPSSSPSVLNQSISTRCLFTIYTSNALIYYYVCAFCKSYSLKSIQFDNM